jgi:hypothetical protein
VIWSSDLPWAMTAEGSEPAYPSNVGRVLSPGADMVGELVKVRPQRRAASRGDSQTKAALHHLAGCDLRLANAHQRIRKAGSQRIGFL